MTPAEAMLRVLGDLAVEATVYCVFVLDPILGADLRDARMVEANAEEVRDAFRRAGKVAVVIPFGRKA